MVDQRMYAIQIKEALDFIKFTQQVNERKADEEKAAEEFLSSKKLKSKGKKSFSELL